jgi:hypothetical protein
MSSALFHEDLDEQALSDEWTLRVARGTRRLTAEDKIRAFHALLPDALQRILRSVARNTRNKESGARGMLPVFSLVFADEASLGNALVALAALRARVARNHSLKPNEALVELLNVSTLGSTQEYTETRRRSNQDYGMHPAGLSLSLGTAPVLASVSIESFSNCESCRSRGKLKVCNGCWNVSYCSYECSARNWANHKKDCHKHAQLTAARELAKDLGKGYSEQRKTEAAKIVVCLNRLRELGDV